MTNNKQYDLSFVIWDLNNTIPDIDDLQYQFGFCQLNIGYYTRRAEISRFFWGPLR